MWRSSIERCASSRWSTSSLERSTIRLIKESSRDSYPALIPSSTGDSLPCCVGTELFFRPWTSSPVSPLETAGWDVSLGLVGVLRERLRVSILDGDDAPDEAREPRPRRASLISVDWEVAFPSEVCDPDLANFCAFGTGLIKRVVRPLGSWGVNLLVRSTCDYQYERCERTTWRPRLLGRETSVVSGPVAIRIPQRRWDGVVELRRRSSVGTQADCKNLR